MNRTVKTLVERVAVGSGVVRLGRRWRWEQTLVLAYHNVVPEGEARAGDVSLHLPFADFRRQLDAISETHDVVPITALGEPPPPSTRRPRIVITFDDAYAGALTCGVDELVKRRMPATVFVAPGLLGSVAWWDVL